MRCFVTGATGHLGSHLVRRLLRERCEVAVLARPLSSFWRLHDVCDRIAAIEGDLCDSAKFESALHRFAPEITFHLGWSGVEGPARNDPSHLAANLSGTLRLIQMTAERRGGKFVGLGSQAEYGPCLGPLAENAPTLPDTLYGAAKLAAGVVGERICAQYGAGFAWLRLVAAYGPMDNTRRLIPYLILSLLDGSRPTLSSPMDRWDYLFADDIADAMWRAALSPAAHGIFNLASGESYSVREIAEKIRPLIDSRAPLDFGKPESGRPVRVVEADITRFRNATGWAPSVSIEEGLRRTVEWYRDNRERRVSPDVSRISSHRVPTPVSE